MWDGILEKAIQNELTRLDPDLFLDKELFEGSVFPVVKYRCGEQIFNVLTYPYLSLDIPLLVAKQEGDIRDAIAQVKANNAAKKEMARQETIKGLEEAAKEHDASTGKIRRWFIPGTRGIQ